MSAADKGMSLLKQMTLACVMLCSAVLAGCGVSVHNAFMGDSITALWSVPGVNLGVPGNTTAQMLARYPAEVSGKGYITFVLLGGTNDVRYGVQTDTSIANIAAMASTSRAAGMNVVLCEIPPIFVSMEKLDPHIRELNARIRELAASEHYYLVDYYDPMANHPEYFKDKLHPNPEGYAVMDKALIPVLESIPQR